jgi:hypothetical protein
MRACRACFAASTWTANASPPESSPANCDFGHGYSPQTWPTTAWVDSISGLLAIYEESTDGDADEVQHCVQRDWGIFTLAPQDVRAFLESAVPGHPLLGAGTKARLSTSEGGSSGADHLTSWTAFSEEIRKRNRYFPKTVPDLALLAQVLSESVRRVDIDIDLFRGRIFEGCAPPKSEMGAPPAEKATAGRANPVGIPYLYLAYSRETCLYEARATTLLRLAVGRFRPKRQLSVLNLADIEPPDFFSLFEVESTDAQVSRAAYHRYLTALGDELRKPIRSSDRLTDYIPTQYLCEMAKSIGLDGVLYSSSLDPSGRNVVLFDVESCECVAEPEIVEVAAVELTWNLVASP